MSNNGLITIPSVHNVKDTIDLIESDVKSKGLTIFARVDHAAGAKEVGLPLAPTLLLIFGNAKGGTPLMQANHLLVSIYRSKCSPGRTPRARRGFPTMIRLGSRRDMDSVTRLIKRSKF